MFHGYAVHEPGGELKPFEYDPGPLGDDEIEIQVRHCGLCHSDLSMIDNDWQASQYPLVPGHEVVGTIVAAGRNVRRLQEGQRVGVGWFAKSCMSCEWCLRGDHNLCAGPRHLRQPRPLRRLCRSRPHRSGLGHGLARQD